MLCVAIHNLGELTEAQCALRVPDGDDGDRDPSTTYCLEKLRAYLLADRERIVIPENVDTSIYQPIVEEISEADASVFTFEAQEHIVVPRDCACFLLQDVHG